MLLVVLSLVILALANEGPNGLNPSEDCHTNTHNKHVCFFPLLGLSRPTSKRSTTLNRFITKREIHNDKVAAEVLTDRDHPNLANLDKEWVIVTTKPFSNKLHTTLIHKDEVPLKSSTGSVDVVVHVIKGSIKNLEKFLIKEEGVEVLTILENRPIYARQILRSNKHKYEVRPTITKTANLYTQCRFGTEGGMTPGYFSWGVPATFENNIAFLNTQFCTLNGNDGTGVAAYVVDSGVNDPVTLSGRIHRDFDYYGGNGYDDFYIRHGTHIAGVIGSTLYGIATNVEIHVIKVLDSTGSGTFASLLAGLQYISINGKVGIINLSLGSLNEYSSAIADLIINMQAQGFVFAVAAGNDNVDSSLEFPANVLGVVVVGSYDQDFFRSFFSNDGVTTTIWAPGGRIISTVDNSTGTNIYSGTSMATSFVTGVLCLQKQNFPNYTANDLINFLYFTTAKNEIFGLTGPNRNRRLKYIVDTSYVPGQPISDDITSNGLLIAPSLILFFIVFGSF